MSDELEKLGSRLAACWLSKDWSEAENLIREMRDAVGGDVADIFSEFTTGRRLESEGDLESAKDRFARVRLRLEAWISTGLKEDIPELLLYMKYVVEHWELSIELQIAGHTDRQRAEIQAKLQQVEGAISEYRRIHHAHRRARMREKLEASDHDEVLDTPFARMLMESPLGTAIFEFMNMVFNAPMLLNRPGSLQAGFFTVLQSVSAEAGDFDKNIVLPWIGQRNNRRDFQLQHNANCSRHLIDSARTRTVHRIFCDSWRRGSSPERHASIRAQHLSGNERLIEGFCTIARYMHRADQAPHPEEKIEHLAYAIHTFVEHCYKDALIALFRLEFDRDDLQRIPEHARQVGIQLTSHWQGRHADRLDLINMDALVIRNAVAHHRIYHLPDGRVRFESKSKRAPSRPLAR